MTTFSYLSPSMRRLFVRVDSAGATDPDLSSALIFWRQDRDGRVFPERDGFSRLPDAIRGHAFLASPDPEQSREWLLTRIGASARAVLHAQSDESRLSRLGNRRIAVRLRRLFEMAIETGEPVCGTFEIEEAERRREIEVLAAPLSGDGPAASLVFGAVSSRARRS